MSKQVPDIRFKAFSSLWNTRVLSELTDYKNGIGHEDGQKSSGNYELVNLNSISIDGGLKHSGKYIDFAESTLCKDDLVMILSDVGHGDLLGRVALIPENDRFVLNQRVALLRPNDQVYPLCLFYNINAHQKYFKLQGAGMSQLNISKGTVENYVSYLPTLPEQTQIGNFFKSLDEKIVLQEQKHEKLVQLKKAMLDKMFTKPGAKVPEIRFKGFTGDWEIDELKDLSSLLTGFPFESKKFINQGITLVRGVNVKRGVLDLSPNITSYWSESRSKGLENYLLQEGDIVIQMDGALIGKSYAKIEACHLPALLVQRVARVRATSLDNRFVYQKIQRDFLGHIFQNKTETAVPHLSLNDIREFEITYPSLDEQQKIGEYFEKLDKLIGESTILIDKYKNIKQALLSKMFV